MNNQMTTGIVPPKYQMHKYLLYFLDPEVEQRYFDFQYVDNAFIPGKVFSFMWVGVAFGSFILLTDPLHNNASYTVESFSNLWWIGVYISTALNSILWLGLFVNRLRQYREWIHLLQIFIGWPNLMIIFLITKKPHVYNYTQILGCSFFSMMIAQARMHRSLPFVTLWPIACLFAVTFGVLAYWPDHTYIEMLYWLVFLLPVGLLHIMEKRTRSSFVDRELAMEAIKESEHKTAVTQRMIANFFPETPTRDLLQQLDGPRDKAYPDTVLIVTDIVGFTAHTSRSDPLDVIAMITSMFQSFDSTAVQYGVEKIATVGDSYCGAVFSTPTLTGTERCVNAMQFACSTLGFAGPGLQLRVGVHIGDVVGVFVGCAPPKFDVFGEGIDVARSLEETSQAGSVHFSKAVANEIASYMGDFRHEPTQHGHVCEAFGVDLSSHQSDGGSTMPIAHVTKPHTALDADTVVEILCSMTGLLAPDEETYSEEDEDQKEKEKSTSDDFNFLLLTFNDKALEKRYQAIIQKSGINDKCSRVFLVITFGLFVVQLNLQSHDSQDQAVASAIVAILAALSCYIQFIGASHRYHSLITWLSYNTVFTLAFLGLTATDTKLKLQDKYVGDIAGTYACIAIFASQYCLDMKLMYRCILTVLTAVLVLVCMIIRRLTYKDEVAAIDPLPLCGLVFVTMSFFPDFSLRTAYRTQIQLHKLQKAAKSRGGVMATSALSIMLPIFATDRILAISQNSKTAHETALSVDGGSSMIGSSEEFKEIDFNNVSATWEYNHVIIMFAKFHSDDAEFTPDAINMTVRAIEEIALLNRTIKVKTIGSTVMLVGGIDDPRTRQEHMSSMVDAAIMVRGVVFQAMKVANLEYHVGIHSGPCFGAVIGGNGAIFDLFGDTVNTASRMMSTSQPGSIQISAVANLLVPPHLRDLVGPRPSVSVKGKGLMEVYAVESDSENGPALTHFAAYDSKAHPTSQRGTTASAIDHWRQSWARTPEHEDQPISRLVFASESRHPDASVEQFVGVSRLQSGGVGESDPEEMEYPRSQQEERRLSQAQHHPLTPPSSHRPSYTNRRRRLSVNANQIQQQQHRRQ